MAQACRSSPSGYRGVNRDSPDDPDVVSLERFVGRHHGGRAFDRWPGPRAADRTDRGDAGAAARQPPRGRGLIGEWIRAGAEQRRREVAGRVKLAEGALDRDLPDDRRAQKDLVRQSAIFSPPPRQSARRRSSHHNAACVSSKSFNGPQRVRDVLGQLVEVLRDKYPAAPDAVDDVKESVPASGTSRATGFPLRAMTMSSPASARSTSLESGSLLRASRPGSCRRSYQTAS